MSPDFLIRLTVFGIAVAMIVRLYMLMLVAQRYLETKTRLAEMETRKRESSE